MPPEILSTAKPTALRLWGFLCVALGGLAMGLGALATWAVVGFPQDTTGTADVVIKGVDTWEGLVVLLAALVALLGSLAIRLLRSSRARRVVAMAIVVLSLTALVVALSVALRPEARLGGSESLDRIAASLAKEVSLPVDVVQAELERQFGAQLRVDLGSGVWLSAAGGLLAAVGGGLSIAWIRRREAAGRQDPGGTEEAAGYANDPSEEPTS